MQDNQDKETSTDEVRSTRETKIPVVAGFYALVHTGPGGSPSLLYNGHRVSFRVVKRPGRGVKHPPPSIAEVKERVELYLYSPSGPSWLVLGPALPLPLKVYFFSAECTLAP